MLSTSQRVEIDGLLATARATGSHVQARFGHLTVAQLNWKPAPDRWSVGQCLDHLVTADTAYFPQFDAILAGHYKPTLWQRVPGLPTFFGRALLKSIHPDNVKKSKAPGILAPASSQVDAGIVRRFGDASARVIGYLEGVSDRGLDPDRIVIASPVLGAITYSLFDAFRVIVHHERRHVQQADRVVALDAFPR
jgi:hypothetical protein